MIKKVLAILLVIISISATLSLCGCSDEKTFVGTWTSDKDGLVMVLNEDGTGTLDGVPLTWELFEDTSNLVFHDKDVKACSVKCDAFKTDFGMKLNDDGKSAVQYAVSLDDYWGMVNAYNVAKAVNPSTQAPQSLESYRYATYNKSN